MNKSIVTLAVWIGFFMIISCASAPVLPPEWRYEKEAIKITLQADPRLNLYNNTAHTLQLCIYQLKDPNGFNQLTETEDGLYKLLEGGMFDASVANFKRLNMSPGQSMHFSTDRAEGARYIGIAAGYATLQKDLITRLITIPAVVVEEGGGFNKQKVSRPERLHLKLRLGPHQIEAGTGE